MQKVLEQYVKHYVRLLFKQRGGEVMTHAEKLGVAYYKAAAHRVEALIDAPKPAWYDFKFKAPPRGDRHQFGCGAHRAWPRSSTAKTEELEIS